MRAMLHCGGLEGWAWYDGLEGMRFGTPQTSIMLHRGKKINDYAG